MDIKFDNLIPLLDKLNEKTDNEKINSTPKITQQATYNNSETKTDTEKTTTSSTTNNPFGNLGNIDELQKKIRMIKKLKNGMNGNPVDMIDILNQNNDPNMKNAITVLRTMPAIMRALGNDEDEKNDGNTFCEEDNKTNNDMPDNQTVKTESYEPKPMEKQTYQSQNIHFDFRSQNNNNNNNRNKNANYNLANFNNEQKGIFTNFNQN